MAKFPSKNSPLISMSTSSQRPHPLIIATPARRQVRMSINGTVLRSSAQRRTTTLRTPYRTPNINIGSDNEYEDEPDETTSNSQRNTIRPSTKTKKKRSYVWLHGNHVDVLQKGIWREKWQCRQCEDVFYSPGTTSHIKDHLQKVHNLMTIATHQAILPGE